MEISISKMATRKAYKLSYMLSFSYMLSLSYIISPLHSELKYVDFEKFRTILITKNIYVKHRNQILAKLIKYMLITFKFIISVTSSTMYDKGRELVK